jgi:hypothetical protein
MSTTVIGGFGELLDRLRLTSAQDDEAKTKRDGLIRFFDSHLDMHQEAFSIGSFRRFTLIRPERDVDLLAPVSSTHWDRYKNDSRAFLYWIREKLKGSYSTTRVSTRGLSIKLAFNIIEADVVPCFGRKGEGYWMPDGSKGWMATNPPFHIDKMAASNVLHDQKLKPIVKLMKAWNTDNTHHLQSFHVELMTERIWSGRAIPSHPSAIASTLGSMSKLVLQTFTDPWGPGQPIDGYLSTSEREVAQRLLVADATRAAKAEASRLAGREFEAYGLWRIIYSSFPGWG